MHVIPFVYRRSICGRSHRHTFVCEENTSENIHRWTHTCLGDRSVDKPIALISSGKGKYVAKGWDDRKVFTISFFCIPWMLMYLNILSFYQKEALWRAYEPCIPPLIELYLILVNVRNWPLSLWHDCGSDGAGHSRNLSLEGTWQVVQVWIPALLPPM